MKTVLSTLSRWYRQYTQRFGVFEPLVHASLLSYAFLLIFTATLNVLVPSFGARHAIVAHNSPVSSGSAVLSDVEAARCITRSLLEDDTDVISRRIQAEYGCGCNQPALHAGPNVPTLSAVLHTTSDSVDIAHLSEVLSRYDTIHELIICEDSGKGGAIRITEFATTFSLPKHFILRTNRLGSTRCYNRALRMISSEYVVFLTDDFLPTTTEWVSEALELLDADPKLGLLSGLTGQMWDTTTANSGIGGDWYLYGEQNDTLRSWGSSVRRIPFLSKRTLKPFMFVECSWLGPLFLRTRALTMVGGFDLLYQPGASGEWQDCILSSSMWTAGWRAGVYNAEFSVDGGGNGLAHSLSRSGTFPNEISSTRFDQATIRHHVLDLNEQLLTPRYDDSIRVGIGNSGSIS